MPSSVPSAVEKLNISEFSDSCGWNRRNVRHELKRFWKLCFLEFAHYFYGFFLSLLMIFSNRFRFGCVPIHFSSWCYYQRNISSSCNVMIHTKPVPTYLPKLSKMHSMRFASLHALVFFCRALWSALTHGPTWQVLPGIGRKLWEISTWKSSSSNNRHDMYHFQGVCGTP